MKTSVLTLALVTLLNMTGSAQVVLNEVYPDPGAGNHEFFELYNSGTSNVPENLDNYTLVSYYEESGGKTGFYVLDMPDVYIYAKSYFTFASANNFNVQGKSGVITNVNWNVLPAGGALTRWENNGSGYTQVAVPANLNDLFFRKNGSGGNHHIFLYKNGVLINGLITGVSSEIIPSYIKSMPNLQVVMLSPATNFSINFNAINNNQVEYNQGATTGSDNGYMRERDGKCGSWIKSTAQVQHTPGLSNGSATGIGGEVTINSNIAFVAEQAVLYYEVKVAPEDALPLTIEAYRDFGTIGQLDASDILFHTDVIPNTSAGIQEVTLVDNLDHVMLVAKTQAGCFDVVISVLNFRTLPVKLLSFNAMLAPNNKVDLSWSTAIEINASHFVIERSFDGKNFSDVGLLFAFGNTDITQNYKFTDNINAAEKTIIYYRLRQVDADGKVEYSAVRIIRANKQTDKVTILTFPNPVTSSLRVSIPNNWQGKQVNYEIVNAAGQTAKRIQIANSSQTETLDLGTLAPGAYLVKVSCGLEIAQQKIVKQ